MSEFQSLVKFYGARERLLIRRVINRQDRLMAMLTTDALVTKKDINPFVLTAAGWDAHYLLGVVNSALIRSPQSRARVRRAATTSQASSSRSSPRSTSRRTRSSANSTA